MNKQVLRLKNKKSRQNSSLQILAIVGLAGSGKSTAAEYMKEQNYPHVYFGGVVLRAMEKAGMEINAENEKIMRHKLREDFGKDVIINEIVEQINGLISAGQKRIIADGLYTWTEYKLLKKNFPGQVKVIALVPHKEIRHKRISNRKNRAFSQQEIIDRDYNEIELLEKGGPIAMADYFIVNKGSEIQTRRKLDKILREIGF